MIADNEMRTGDLDYSPEPVKTVNSIFDHAPQVEYKLDEKQASTYRPDSFELDLARQEETEHDAKIELIINRMKGKV